MLAYSQRPTESILSTLLVEGPLLCTEKMDGIRCLNGDLGAVSRKLIQIPNRHIVATLQKDFGGMRLDGELLTYTDGLLDDFNTVQSKVMARDGAPDFKYHIFDVWGVDDDYQGRAGWLSHFLTETGAHHRTVLPRWAFSVEDVYALEQQYIEAGWEGMIARTARSPYKQGRSTAREGYMLKFKPFADEEATIVGFEERMHNANLQGMDNLGFSKRSSHQEGKVPTGMLGSFVVRSPKWGMFNVSPGPLTELQRCNVWQNQEEWLHKQITFKYQPNHSKDKPHAAQYKAIRHL